MNVEGRETERVWGKRRGTEKRNGSENKLRMGEDKKEEEEETHGEWKVNESGYDEGMGEMKMEASREWKGKEKRSVRGNKGRKELNKRVRGRQDEIPMKTEKGMEVNTKKKRKENKGEGK